MDWASTAKKIWANWIKNRFCGSHYEWKKLWIILFRRKLRQKILELGLASSKELSRIEKEIATSVDDAVDFAKSGDLPRPEDALTQVFAP